MDLRAAIPIDQPVTLQPGERQAIPTGIAMRLPDLVEGQIRPRSGLALKHGIGMVNTPGTIDWDYRGEIRVILVNLGQEPFIIERGMRIAQIVFNEVVRMEPDVVLELDVTTRGAGGFGSTGR